MYSKLFSKIVDSSIWLEPDHVRLVWLTLLALKDQDGYVWLSSVGNVANRARVSLEDAQDAIATLEAPDRHNPGQEYEGRRIERVPDGWFVLNAKKYDELVRVEMLREMTRLRVARHRERKRSADPGNAPVTDPSRSGNAIQTTDIDLKEEVHGPFSGPPPPPPVAEKQPPDLRCPHKRILELWAEELPTLPRHNPNLWNERRAINLGSRWRQVMDENKYQTAEDGVEYFRRLFQFIGKSAFLMGRASPTNGRPVFQCELEWLIKPSNWVKVLEGKYHQ